LAAVVFIGASNQGVIGREFKEKRHRRSSFRAALGRLWRRARSARAGRGVGEAHPHRFGGDHARDHRTGNLATIGFAWWFRASNARATYLPDWAFSGHLELIVWAIPTLVITFLGGIAWFGSHALDPYKPLASTTKPIEIEVVSLDWKWLFIYQNDGIATVNQLVVPVATPLHFRLTSSGVMNSFSSPSSAARSTRWRA
jgi:hypothetical protein